MKFVIKEKTIDRALLKSYENGMVRFLSFLLALFLIAGGFALAVVDGARSIAAGQPVLMSLQALLNILAPAQLSRLQDYMASVFGSPAAFIMDMPAFCILWVMGGALWLSLRRRPQELGYKGRR